MIRRVAAAAFGSLLLATTPTYAQDVPIYPAEAFYETTNFSFPRGGAAFTTDGKKLLVTSDQTGIFNAYEMDLRTGRRTALTNSTTNAVYALGWFGDDESILYTADKGGDELNHIYLRLPGGKTMDLTPGDKVKAQFHGFTPDRRSFFVSTNERDPAAFDIYRYDAVTLERAMVFENEMGLGGLVVSPQGDRIAGILEKSAADNDIYLIDRRSDNGALVQLGLQTPRGTQEGPMLLTEHRGNIEHRLYGFDDSGRNLVIGSNEDAEFTEAFALNLDQGTRRDFLTDTWDVSQVGFSPSGKFSVRSVNADGRTDTVIWDNRRNRPVRLPSDMPDGAVTRVSFTPDERHAAMAISSSRQPTDIYLVPLSERDGRIRPLTNALEGTIEPDHLVRARVVRYASFDGLDIPAIQYRPHGADEDDQVPAVVLVHGGPGGQSRASYSALVQHLVNNGYGVLAVNNRGSSGYGKTFFHMDDRRHGEVDLKDVVAARGYLEDLDWVDGEKVAVMGGSYGGYMTMAALAFTPEAFEAGINIFGVTNWERTLSSIPPWWGSFRERLYGEMGDPATDKERHRRISPLFHADQVTKPVLIVQGANDPRVLQIESDEMVAELRKNDVPVEYVLFDDEGHGFRKRENRIEASEAYVRFLDRYLLEDR